MSGLRAIVAALDEEIRPVVDRMDVAYRIDPRGCRMWRGRLEGAEVVAVRTGDGERAAGDGMRRLLERFSPSVLIVIGVSGGLSPALPAGAVYVADRVLADGRSRMTPDGTWTRRLLAACSNPGATFLTSDRVLCSREAKTAAFSRTGAPGPALVDLETAVYAAVAEEAGIPWAAVRSVLDPAEESLPLDFNACRDAGGRIRRARVLLRMLAQPAGVPALLRMRRKMQGACAPLADVLVRSCAGRERGLL